jgi:glycosyltransferase involved in cell wall biosynthesis
LTGGRKVGSRVCTGASEIRDPRRKAVRILLVSHYFLPAHTAGVENYTYRLAKALSARHDVVVFCREDGFWDREVFEEDDVYGGVSVHRVYFNGAMDFRTCYQNPVLDAVFRDFLLRWRPDIVHFQHLERLSAGFIDGAWRLGIPRVLTLNDFWFVCPQIQLLRGEEICAGPDEGRSCATCPGLLPEALRLRALARARERVGTRGARWLALAWRLLPRRLRRMGEAAVVKRSFFDLGIDLAATRERFRHLKEAFGKVDLVLGPSHFLLELFRQFGFSHSAAVYSDYGIPTFDPSRLQEPSSAPLRFGCFSAIVPHKGIELLLRAFRRLPSERAELIVRGQGSPLYDREMRRMAARDKRVTFLPPYDDAGLAEAFSRIDVLVVPSLWYENSPIVIHEAAVAGVPVIGADIGGMAEYVKDGVNGLLFRCRDEHDLARTMQRFVDDPALVRRLRRVPFTIKTMEADAAALEQHYTRLLSVRAAGAP